MENIAFKQMDNNYLKEIASIYNYYVINTTATFHAHELSADEIKELVFFDNEKYVTFVILRDDCICGFVSLKQHKTREAYNDTAEVSVYLDPDKTGKGLGSLAVNYIENHAKTKGIHVLIATICGENEKSINAFSRNGFFKCAHYKEVGRKFGQLLDVVAYQKILDK